MAIEERDKAHLADMLAAARDARVLAGGLSYDALMADMRTRLALERALEIIGEAARRVSPEFRQMHPKSRGTRSSECDRRLYTTTCASTRILSGKLPQLTCPG